jgi:hypothetical protein
MIAPHPSSNEAIRALMLDRNLLDDGVGAILVVVGITIDGCYATAPS